MYQEYGKFSGFHSTKTSVKISKFFGAPEVSVDQKVFFAKGLEKATAMKKTYFFPVLAKIWSFELMKTKFRVETRKF
jgi:hypothetical protein